ncbi:HalOD1 output domain-containing protein [Halomicrobium sp. HM KBTZ05]|uniref:Halobacterial output domain-containing protein n=1 Tax=Halomicrobium mukohataei TaxID=57705 RepID=A0A847UDM1_9EURY|nr:HalOD1 output domain-containing protein [Halomicrobium mukohataei]NLV10327.1 hypothetical protein [Halomicrobium mukohataei]
MNGDLVVEYDEEFDRHVVEVDADDDRSTSEVVVYAMSEVSGEEPTALRPLGTVIDPDALDTIFDRCPDDDRGDAHISFEYEGYEVTVFSHGRMTITEPRS